MCPITINKALLLQEGILKFEISWTAVDLTIVLISIILSYTRFKAVIAISMAFIAIKGAIMPPRP